MISALVHWQRARVFQSCQAFDKALEAADTGLGFVANNPGEERFFLLSEKAQALEGLGELRESARLLREILRNSERLRLETNNSSLLEIAARVAEKRGRYKEALDYHKKLHASERARLASRSENQRILFSVELQLEKARREAEQERARSQQLEQEAARDGMTGLYNHATFQKLLREACQTGMLSLVLLDVDHFKSYNDTYGHPAGDTLLKELAALLTEQLRTDDILARYGGEEFAVILPGKSLALAYQVAERLRGTVATCPRLAHPVTISVGVAATPPLPPEPSLLLEAADRALYQAKHLGRDKVEVAEGHGKFR
nr:diguanylate cyclase [Armatimonas rosea]